MGKSEGKKIVSDGQHMGINLGMNFTHKEAQIDNEKQS